jgi:hypothetical protein
VVQKLRFGGIIGCRGILGSSRLHKKTVDLPLRVSELINQASREWNEQVLEEHFCQWMLK